MQPFVPHLTRPGWRTFLVSRKGCGFRQPERYELPQRRTLKLPLPSGGRIHCLRGRLWITAGPRSGDIVLRAGESWSGSRACRAVVEALENAVVEIVPRP